MNESILLKEPLTDCGNLSSYKASFDFGRKSCTFTSFVGKDEGNQNGFSFKRFDDCRDLGQICYKPGNSHFDGMECEPIVNDEHATIYIRMAKDNPEQMKYCPKVAILKSRDRSYTTYYMGMQKQVSACKSLFK